VILALALACGTPDDVVIDAAECPPADPTGLAVGDIAQDVAFTDCAGAPVSLHGLCGQPALIANWYGWCPSCEDNAALARDLAAAHAELAVAIVLDEDPLNHPVDADLCQLYSDTYPSDAQIWMDPAGELEVYGDTDLILVLDRDGRLVFNRRTATEDAITAAVEGVLAD
jgi:hypothetical protein